MIRDYAPNKSPGLEKQNAREGEKLHALTSLRFFAALFVVAYHTYWSSTPLTTSSEIGTRIASLGFLSVGFFFALSGYILGMVYLRGRGRMPNKSFFVARFARIYPLYVVTLLLDTPVLVSHLQKQYGSVNAAGRFAAILITNLLMLQAWAPSFRGLDNPNWSLSVEAFFYLLFPFLGAKLWRLKGSTIWLAAAAIWVLNQLLIYVVAPHLTPNQLKFNPILHLGTFAAGILLARWQTRDDGKGLSYKRVQAKVLAAIVLAALGCTVLVTVLPVLPLGNVHDGLMTPVFLLIIWAFSINGSFAARALSSKWLVVLGEASFGLYLIHAVLQHFFHWINPKIISNTYYLYLLTCIGLSLGSFYYFETPLRWSIITRLKTRTRETSEMAADAQ